MRRPFTLQRTVFALFLFGVSFGYVEAAVVVYLRTLCETARASHLHLRADPSLATIFPLLTPAEIEGNASLLRTLKIELGREAATMVMLAALALAVGRNGTEALAALVMTFGIWDVAFYGFLRLFIHWPASLFTWDLLFLLPVPWSGPVLAPVIVSLSMIAAGFMVLQRAWQGHPVRLNPFHWTGISLGGGAIVLSFTLGFRNLTAGGIPHDFHWLLFATGESLAMGSFLHASRRKGDAANAS